MEPDVGGLLWGIRSGFRDYLDALPDAAVELEHATRGPDGYRFPSAVGSGGFAGRVRITAHGGALDITLALPAIESTPDAGTVLTAETGDRRIRLARLLDVADVATFLIDGGTAHDVALTPDGAEWLGGVYNPWARMDPVRVDRAPVSSDAH